MKFVIVFSALFAMTLAAPQTNRDVVIVSKDSDVQPQADGSSYGFENSADIQAKEPGQLKNVGSLDEGVSVQGSFQYVGADGFKYTVNY